MPKKYSNFKVIYLKKFRKFNYKIIRLNKLYTLYYINFKYYI